MLAAAGSPDVHPHANSKPEDKVRWDHDMASFNRDLKQVEAFFLDILNGKLKTEDEQNKIGMEFFGVQGPWYTVGYKMGVMVEKRFGREALIQHHEQLPQTALALQPGCRRTERQRWRTVSALVAGIAQTHWRAVTLAFHCGTPLQFTCQTL